MKQTYNDKVFKRLHDLKQGEEIDLTKDAKGNPVSENQQQKFIEAVKIFIHCGYDLFYGYVIELSGSYGFEGQEPIPPTKLRKNGIWY